MNEKRYYREQIYICGNIPEQESCSQYVEDDETFCCRYLEYEECTCDYEGGK
jgi:uncharacterized protein involved in type VI secretion and phage assembly